MNLKTNNPPLNLLPKAPIGKSGWPWTYETDEDSPAMENSASWPKITIITPSYNQGKYIEETIRSVILQGYPDLEYIIIDGGSTDCTIDIIKKYEKWISYWISEPDKGQSHAINKGLLLAKGKWINWINSDDLLAPDALKSVAVTGSTLSDSIIAGSVMNFNRESDYQHLIQPKKITLRNVVRFWKKDCVWHQPGIFLPGIVASNRILLDESLHYVMDYDLLCRLLKTCETTYVNKELALFRIHDFSKGISQSENTSFEHMIVARRYWSETGLPVWRNELEMKLWLLRASGSAIKRKNWSSLRILSKALFGKV